MVVHTPRFGNQEFQRPKHLGRHKLPTSKYSICLRILGSSIKQYALLPKFADERTRWGLHGAPGTSRRVSWAGTADIEIAANQADWTGRQHCAGT
jgi:hypothetical protein